MHLNFIFLQNISDEWTNFIGHFHPLLVHLPIGILLIGIVLEFINRKGGNQTHSKALNIVFFWGAISAILSCIAGYYLKQSGGYEESALNWHQNLGIGVAVISSCIYLFKKLGNFSLLSFFNYLIKPFIIALFILIFITGHLGGNMTHGSDYLTASLPQPFRGWLGFEQKLKQPKVHKIADPANAIAYFDVVQPILENKCYQCHSAEKQKGKLRLDTKDFMLKGGENGSIFLAGNALNSEMIKRAMLPENDDDHMPPKGKAQLNTNEIALLHWWIQNGASFDTKVNDLPQDAVVKPILAGLMAGASIAGSVTSAPESIVYSMKINAASGADIKKLKDKNVLVLPLAKDLNLLEISCVNAKEFDDESAKLLNNISDQIVWLKLTNTKITDASTPIIGKLPNVVKLFLNHSKITDLGIKNLSAMKYLEYLNLVDTQITDACLSELAKVKSLKKLYVWQTNISKAAVEAFKKANPHVEVIMGWEGKELVSDTTKMTTQNLVESEN